MTPWDPPAQALAAAEISVAELASLGADAPVLCVDTRGSMAYRIGHVPGSVNIRDDHLEDMLRQGFPFPSSRKIVLICPIGEYSTRLAASLTQPATTPPAWRAASWPGATLACHWNPASPTGTPAPGRNLTAIRSSRTAGASAAPSCYGATTIIGMPHEHMQGAPDSPVR